MPYIAPEDRAFLAISNHPLNEGELNYTITKICLLPEPIKTRDLKIRMAVDEYLDAFGPDSYKLFNNVIGAIECARLEFERRMMIRGQVDDLLDNVKRTLYRTRVAPYENEKIRQNGDVYPCHS